MKGYIVNYFYVIFDPSSWKKNFKINLNLTVTFFPSSLIMVLRVVSGKEWAMAIDLLLKKQVLLIGLLVFIL